MTDHNSQLDAAAAAGRTSNYGCQANIDVATGNITWLRRPNGYVTTGTCLCDNWLMNEVADTVLEAMPMIAQVRIPHRFLRVEFSLLILYR